jgi:hypothetical protein
VELQFAPEPEQKLPSGAQQIPSWQSVPLGQ